MTHFTSIDTMWLGRTALLVLDACAKREQTAASGPNWKANRDTESSRLQPWRLPCVGAKCNDVLPTQHPSFRDERTRPRTVFPLLSWYPAFPRVDGGHASGGCRVVQHVQKASDYD